MIYLILGAVFVFAIVAHLLHHHNIVRKVYLASKMPGPPAWPVIGNGLMFVNKTAVENFSIVCQVVIDYGDVVRMWIGPDLNVLMSNPLDVEILLSSSKFINKSGEYKYIRPWLNEGLLLSEGKKWFQRRKILTPAFHFKILEQFVEIFDRQSNVMVETLAHFRSDEPVELYPIVTLYALDVICESAMGTTINAQKKSDSEYVLSVKELSHVLHLRMFDVLLRVDFIFMFSELCRKMKKALKILHDFTDNVIRERRDELLHTPTGMQKPNATTNEREEDVGEKRKMAFLDILLKAKIDGKPLTDLDIREEVDTFMFEGHDTTTSGITFSLYNIAKYPEVQRKCFEEIQQVIGSDKTKTITLQDLNNLHYIEMVIKETLRLYPSVPLIGRHIPEETTINGYTFAAGTNLIVPIYSMGRNPKIFADPEVFRPERFEAEEVSETMNAFAYIPFSAGPRNCIGQKFAMLELKSILTKVLRYSEIRLAGDSRQEPALLAELILVPGSKINFHLKPRQYN